MDSGQAERREERGALSGLFEADDREEAPEKVGRSVHYDRLSGLTPLPPSDPPIAYAFPPYHPPSLTPSHPPSLSTYCPPSLIS